MLFYAAPCPTKMTCRSRGRYMGHATWPKSMISCFVQRKSPIRASGHWTWGYVGAESAVRWILFPSLECSADHVLWYFRSPWLHFDFIYHLTAVGRRFKQNCEFVHSISENIIHSRRTIIVRLNQLHGVTLHSSSVVVTFRLTRAWRQWGRVVIWTSSTFYWPQRMKMGKGWPIRKSEMKWIPSSLKVTHFDSNRSVFWLVTWLVLGHDTTASSISWALYSFAENPDAQKKAQDEIDAVLEGRDSDFIEWFAIRT